MYFAFRLSSLYKEPIRSWLVSSVAVFAAAQLGACVLYSDIPDLCLLSDRTAFGIVAAYNNFRNPFPLFAMDVHEKLGWQTLSYLVFAVVCVSLNLARKLLFEADPPARTESRDIRRKLLRR